MRLDRFLVQQLSDAETPTSQIRDFIVSGQVTVDRDVIRDIKHPINRFSHITLKNKVLQNKTAYYIMLNKPAGVVSSTQHNSHKTVIDLIQTPYQQELHLAGRLDLNTTGLMILTNNGTWSKKLTQAKTRIPKAYLVETENPITEEYAQSFNEGALLNAGKETVKLLPAHLNILNSHTAKLIIYEGKHHQIKRMFAHFQNKVVALHRESMGEIILDPSLKQGECRPLTKEEVMSIEQIVS